MSDPLIRDYVPSAKESRILLANGEPKILFPRRLRLLAREYTQLETEFAWHGTVTRNDQNEFLLTEFYPTPQEASSVHVTLLKAGNHQLLRQFGEQGLEGEEKINSLRFWGQSHHGFGVTPSTIDDKTFERIRSQNLPWFIQGIFNRRQEANFKLYLGHGEIVVENVAWVPVDELDDSITARAQSEIEQHLTVVNTPVALQEPRQPDAKNQAFEQLSGAAPLSVTGSSVTGASPELIVGSKGDEQNG